MDPDLTAPTGAVRSGSTLFVCEETSGSTLFVCEASNILVDDKKHTFSDYAL